MPPRGPIVIVGGGLSGLTLAQVLNVRRIPNIILERRPRSSVKTYGINLRKWAAEPLSQRIGLEYSSFRKALAVEFPSEEHGRIGSPMMDAKSGDPMVQEDPGCHLTRSEDGYFRARAVALQALLSEGVDIRYDHCADEIAPSDHRAIVRCLNPNTGELEGYVEGAMVVGADSLHSRDWGMIPFHFVCSLMYCSTLAIGMARPAHVSTCDRPTGKEVHEPSPIRRRHWAVYEWQ